jgi:hypothetical protein
MTRPRRALSTQPVPPPTPGTAIITTLVEPGVRGFELRGADAW